MSFCKCIHTYVRVCARACMHACKQFYNIEMIKLCSFKIELSFYIKIYIYFTQIQILPSLEGASLARSCRAIMRSLMTHGLMSLFSVMGQKGKLPFRDHLLCKVVSSKYISIDLCAYYIIMILL